ncbi:hypothetical protein AMJ80_06795, partial [bacterium SM23_31]
MRLTYFFVILPLFFFQCGSDSDYKQQATSEKNEQYAGELLTLEMSSGSEKYGTKDEFLLAFPMELHVND